MQRFFYIFSILVASLLILVLVLWVKSPSVISSIFSSKLKVPVSIESIEFSSNSINIQNLYIGNPKYSKTNFALFCKELDINAKLMQLLSRNLIIEKITLSDIAIGFEQYNNKVSNWSLIMEKNSSKKGNKKFLIKVLELNNISVVLTEANGNVKKFPPIAQLVFYNLTEENGFDKVEEAIMHKIIDSIMQKYQLDMLMRTMKMMPRLFNVPMF